MWRDCANAIVHSTEDIVSIFASWVLGPGSSALGIGLLFLARMVGKQKEDREERAHVPSWKDILSKWLPVLATLFIRQ